MAPVKRSVRLPRCACRVCDGKGVAESAHTLSVLISDREVAVTRGFPRVSTTVLWPDFVRYVTTAALVNELVEAADERTLSRPSPATSGSTCSAVTSSATSSWTGSAPSWRASGTSLAA